MKILKRQVIWEKYKKVLVCDLTSLRCIHISIQEYTQLSCNVFQHNQGDPLFDQ